MKPFRFQQFDIQQSKDVFRVGTDGVLLGALASVESASAILEIGSGTGLISLMLAQRNSKASILALDINENAVELASTNFLNSPFSNRMNCELADFKFFSSDTTFDFIVSNPPYFEANDSEKDVLARQKVELDFQDLVTKAHSLLSENGILSLIIPATVADEICEIAFSLKLSLVRKVSIFGIENGSLKRTILEFSKTNQKTEFLDFIIEKSPRNYSDQYLELTKEFHIFK